MTDHNSAEPGRYSADGKAHEIPESKGNPSFHVNNDRKGNVEPHGEELTGREILARVGLTVEKYELWTVVHGKTGAAIDPDQRHYVKPGDHFRATIRGTDYSCQRGKRIGLEVGR